MSQDRDCGRQLGGTYRSFAISAQAGNRLGLLSILVMLERAALSEHDIQNGS